MPMQTRNAELVGLLETDFVGRAEPNYAWKSAVSCLLALPGVRAVWPMSVVDYTQPECTDVSGHGNHLQAAVALGNVTFGYDDTADPKILVPVAYFGGGANQYLLRADGGVGNWADILGNETHIIAAQRGLSLGGWFYFAALPGAVAFLLAKDDIGAQRSYEIRILAANTIRLVLRAPAGNSVGTSANTIQVGWNYIAATWDATTGDIIVIVNDTATLNAAVAAAAPLNDTTTPFTIGGNGAGGSLFTGYASLCWLCAQNIGQLTAVTLLHQQRAMYNV